MLQAASMKLHHVLFAVYVLEKEHLNSVRWRLAKACMMLNPWSAFPLVDISDAADVCPIRHASVAAIHRDTEAYVLPVYRYSAAWPKSQA